MTYCSDKAIASQEWLCNLLHQPHILLSMNLFSTTIPLKNLVMLFHNLVVITEGS